MSAPRYNFDFPPATQSASDQDSANLPARLQHIRQALQREREQQRAENDVAASERRSRLADPSQPPMPRRNRRGPRGPNRSHGAFEDQPRRIRSPPRPEPSDPPTSAIRNRPHAEPSQRFSALRRARQQREQSGTPLSELTELERAGERLAEISQSISQLIGPNNLSNADLLRLEFGPPRDDLSERRSFKRRKLDRDDVSAILSSRYGHFGQVVPGRLRMEIVSCDGGEYSDNSGDLHRVGNALKNDASVYCTKKSHCNMILRHHGESTFSLDKIVIRAPERGFTAPYVNSDEETLLEPTDPDAANSVQEGMIFLAMDTESLLTGTAPYQIDYGAGSSTSSRASSTSSSSSRRPDRISLLESLHDPEVLAGMARRHDFRDRSEQQTPEEREARYARLLRMRRRLESRQHRDTTSDNCDYSESADRPAIISPSAPTPPPALQGLHVTQEEDDQSSESEPDQPSASIMADRLRRDSRWRAESEEDEYEDEVRNVNHLLWDRRTGPGIIRSARRSTPSKIEPEDSAVLDGDVLAPHARFFMQKNKSKITIRFDPPVSGKFILLKLWSPSKHGNIDIQNIAVHGFSGPRYFPAVEMR
ncbi:regulator of chromosome condensation-like protein [Diplodia corticola]|uniref:Regulator of chromosome condensation-like protein n=1 Tax=Diplodia corticola TaxID=236234 RepID=A0A1J9RUT8_9PEZI|nr:regulator of chromosome condensation-like protein [Diplodia corticola]OJD31612.1 regulator of chromosome condensation-like protein [Diplodia corticola]